MIFIIVNICIRPLIAQFLPVDCSITLWIRYRTLSGRIYSFLIRNLHACLTPKVEFKVQYIFIHWQDKRYLVEIFLTFIKLVSLCCVCRWRKINIPLVFHSIMIMCLVLVVTLNSRDGRSFLASYHTCRQLHWLTFILQRGQQVVN